jgi:hypothetical protein
MQTACLILIPTHGCFPIPGSGSPIAICGRDKSRPDTQPGQAGTPRRGDPI